MTEAVSSRVGHSVREKRPNLETISTSCGEVSETTFCGPQGALWSA